MVPRVSRSGMHMRFGNFDSPFRWRKRSGDLRVTRDSTKTTSPFSRSGSEPTGQPLARRTAAGPSAPRASKLTAVSRSTQQPAQRVRPNWGGHGTTLATAVLAAAAGPYRQSAAALAAAALASCHPCPHRQASKLVSLLAAASLAAATAEGTKVYRNVTGSKTPGGAGTAVVSDRATR